MSNESALQTVMNGIDNVGRLLSLWLAFGLAIGAELGAILAVALINEPFGWTLHAGNIVAIGAAVLVYWQYPTVRLGTVWQFATVTFLGFAVFATLTGTLDARTSGSLYNVVRAILVWIVALAMGCVVAWTDNWRELLPSV